MATATTLIAALLVVIGATFALIAAIGILRLPDLYTRMHAASKAGTLGSGLMLVALAVVSSDQATVTRALAGIVFFVLTAPIAAHLLAKAAHSSGYRLWDRSVLDEMPAELSSKRKENT